LTKYGKAKFTVPGHWNMADIVQTWRIEMSNQADLQKVRELIISFAQRIYELEQVEKAIKELCKSDKNGI
jgi:hypothetical protein